MFERHENRKWSASGAFLESETTSSEAPDVDLGVISHNLQPGAFQGRCSTDFGTGTDGASLSLEQKKNSEAPSTPAKQPRMKTTTPGISTLSYPF
jgi:hypothetical protein